MAKTHVIPKSNEIGLIDRYYFASLFVKKIKLEWLIHSNMSLYKENDSKIDQKQI
jgi:hypothetical protein